MLSQSTSSMSLTPAFVITWILSLDGLWRQKCNFHSSTKWISFWLPGFCLWLYLFPSHCSIWLLSLLVTVLKTLSFWNIYTTLSLASFSINLIQEFFSSSSLSSSPLPRDSSGSYHTLAQNKVAFAGLQHLSLALYIQGALPGLS